VQLSYNPFGEGTGEILLDNVNCLGNETWLTDCQHRGWGEHNCGHNEDVAIKCVDNLAITGTVTRSGLLRKFEFPPWI